MGNRSKLQAYFREDRFDERERNYYIQFSKVEWTRDTKKYLFNLASEIKDVWNSNFGYFPDDFPSCDYLNLDGVNYFAPDTGMTKGQYLCWDKHDEIPDCFLVLFSVDEYKDKHEVRGKIYCNKRFYTTVNKALERLNKHEMTNDMSKIKKALEELPSETILELDFSEVIQSQYHPTYHSLEYYLNKVRELSL